MTKTLKSVSKGFTVNSAYDLDPYQLDSIIRVLKSSRDNLNKAQVAHISIKLKTLEFDKSLINTTLIKILQRQLKTGFGYFIALEKCTTTFGYHIHIMLTFSTGNYLPFTVLNNATTALHELDDVESAIAFARKEKHTEPYNYYKNKLDSNKNYFHNLKDKEEFKDAVYRYSYLSKKETKEKIKEFEGMRLTQSKIPTNKKTKQEQLTRKRTM
jgi:hypothetical protein